MTRTVAQWGVALLAGWAALVNVRAATSIVAMRNYTFSPSNLVVRPGDSVLWSNSVSMPVHDSTQGVSNTPTALRLWASGDLALRQTFRFTFTNAGEYPYICKRHVVDIPQGNPPTQTGLVWVTTMTFPPSAKIASPTNTQVYLNRFNVPVTTTTGDLDGTVRKVQLFLGPNLIGTATNAPFSFTTPSLFAGSHTLTVWATDNDGLVTTSAPVNITIRPRTNRVTMANYSFTPSSLPNGTVGDTIIFTNAADLDHTATGTSTELFCGASTIPANTGCLVVLSNAGVFPYQCTFHPPPTFSMTGLVVVAGPPRVRITAPTDNTALPAPASFEITVDANKAGGTVTNVEFFANDVSLGRDTTDPFRVNVADLPAGTYTLTARAIDDSGYSGFAAPIVVSVGTPVQLLSPLLSGEMFQFDVTTSPGLTYVIERSPTLPPDWLPLQTNIATGATLRVTESIPAGGDTQMFYRAYLQQ